MDFLGNIAPHQFFPDSVVLPAAYPGNFRFVVKQNFQLFQFGTVKYFVGDIFCLYDYSGNLSILIIPWRIGPVKPVFFSILIQEALNTRSFFTTFEDFFQIFFPGIPNIRKKLKQS